MSKDMASVICQFSGFEIVRVETRDKRNGWGVRRAELDDLKRELGKPKLTLEQQRPAPEASLGIILEFRPRKFRAMNGVEGVGRLQSKAQGGQASSSTSQSRDALSEDEEPVPEQSMAHP